MQSDLKALEFGGIQRLLEKLTSTVYGADAARALEPAPSIGVAMRMQVAVSAARRLIEASGMPSLLRHIPDIRAALRQASSVGAALSANALHHVRVTINTIAQLRALIDAYPDLYLDGAAAVEPPQELVTSLEKSLQPSGHIRPDASVKLAQLQTQLKELYDTIAQTLKTRARELDLPGASEERVVWSGHRGMLAVPSAAAEKIKGVRRGTAANGRDIHVEPLEAVALNNRIETLVGAQEQEQQIIRRALTDQVRTHAAAVQRMVDVLTWIDLALAGGQLSVHLNASAPQLIAEPTVVLDRAYHPAMLLQFADGNGPQPVPLSVALDARQPMLVITGPNTGGKTVVLKTLGLLVTMAHCGLHVPADGECIVGNFTRVIVGIGDAQNLQHHLSTFAGHVEVLKRLLHEADAQTLVLIDELGTGTDPEEGAALAMAVLDELVRRDVRGIITTHLPPLKTFAAKHARLRNASMQFDQDALQPTYRLEVGTSGKSLGLIIAGKSGLPETLIAVARQHLRTIAPARDEDD